MSKPRRIGPLLLLGLLVCLSGLVGCPAAEEAADDTGEAVEEAEHALPEAVHEGAAPPGEVSSGSGDEVPDLGPPLGEPETGSDVGEGADTSATEGGDDEGS